MIPPITLHRVRITRLAQHTFYAAITVDGANGPVQIDARPSDALTLAVLRDAPITVDVDVLHAVEAQRRDRGIPTADEVRTQAQQHAAAIIDDAMAEWGRVLAQLREQSS